MDNTVLIVLGMAGSGKSTFCHRLYSWLSEGNIKIDSRTGLNDEVCGINLDPAAATVKMPVHYDIRDTVPIENLMQEKKLGPNGAILTSLNLFITKIDEFITQIVELKPKYTVIDTPGQIEMFTTSVSGQILVKCLSRTEGIRVKLVYVVDGEKAQNPQCFISNMLFATSIHYLFKEPMLIAVNKSDVEGVEKIGKWASDFETFEEVLPEEDMATPITRSIALWMEEFYSTFDLTCVSAATGMGKKQLLQKIDEREEKVLEKSREEAESEESIETHPFAEKEPSEIDKKESPNIEKEEEQDGIDKKEKNKATIQNILEALKKTTILCTKDTENTQSDENTTQEPSQTTE